MWPLLARSRRPSSPLHVPPAHQISPVTKSHDFLAEGGGLVEQFVHGFVAEHHLLAHERQRLALIGWRACNPKFQRDGLAYRANVGTVFLIPPPGYGAHLFRLWTAHASAKQRVSRDLPGSRRWNAHHGGLLEPSKRRPCP